jgi:gephyrin
VYKVVTSQTHALTDVLPPGSIYRINTGNPLPAGTDTVIMVEDTRLISTTKDPEGIKDGEEDEVETLAQVPAGENVRVPGSDVRRGDLVLQKGERIRSSGGEIGTLAFVGRKEVYSVALLVECQAISVNLPFQVEVYRKPVVAILSTGNELVDLQSPHIHSNDDDWGGIFDTNRPSLQALLEGDGYKVADLGIVPDELSL